jgi:hypothetical protein
MAAPPKNHPFRHAMFLRTTRNHLAAASRAEGADRAEARDFADDFTDEELIELAAHVEAKSPKGTVPKMGAGGIVAFLLAILNSPYFAELIAFIMSLFSSKAERIEAIRAVMAALAAVPEPAPPPAA